MEMTIKEFKDKYMGKNSKWNFNKFSIVCNKCKSKNIEFNGFLESEEGYYGEHSLEGSIIIKCHNCGNAFKIDASQDNDLKLNTNGEKRVNEEI